MWRGRFYSLLLRWVCAQYFDIVYCSKVLRDNACMYIAHVSFYVCCQAMQGSVFVVYRGLLKVVGFICRCEVYV